jgi:uncharacterized protein
MNKPDFERAKHYALTRLSQDLSPSLVYHSLEHTRDDVVQAALRLATIEGVNGDARMLLLTAAWYHDLGYVGCPNGHGHETCGVGIATEMLPEFGYSPEHIAVINQMIMATQLPQTPRNLLDRIIADADLDSLGRDDFLETSLRLRSELETMGITMSDEEWYQRQCDFLLAHSYFTEAARTLRDATKRRNIQLLNRLIAKSRASED